MPILQPERPRFANGAEQLVWDLLRAQLGPQDVLMSGLGSPITQGPRSRHETRCQLAPQCRGTSERSQRTQLSDTCGLVWPAGTPVIPHMSRSSVPSGSAAYGASLPLPSGVQGG